MISRLQQGDALFAPALIDYEVCAVISSLAKPTPPKVADPEQAIRDLLDYAGERTECAIEHIA